MNLYYLLEKYNLLDLDNELAANIVSSLSNKDIQTADIRTYFREQLLWYWFSPQDMAGAIQISIESGQLPVELTNALGEMWSSLFGQSATKLLTQSNIQISQRIYQGIIALVAVGVLTTEHKEGFYANGGGLLFPEVTSKDVQQAKDDHAAQEAAEAAEEARLEAEMELRNEWDFAMGTAGAEEAFYNGDKTALIAAINKAVVAMSTPRRG